MIRTRITTVDMSLSDGTSKMALLPPNMTCSPLGDLGKLPLEVRMMIYGICLRKLRVQCDNHKYRLDPSKLALLRTSHDMYEEVEPLLAAKFWCKITIRFTKHTAEGISYPSRFWLFDRVGGIIARTQHAVFNHAFLSSSRIELSQLNRFAYTRHLTLVFFKETLRQDTKCGTADSHIKPMEFATHFMRLESLKICIYDPPVPMASTLTRFLLLLDPFLALPTVKTFGFQSMCEAADGRAKLLVLCMRSGLKKQGRDLATADKAMGSEVLTQMTGALYDIPLSKG